MGRNANSYGYLIMKTNKNLRAFLIMVRHGEGTYTPTGYRTLFGGGTFESYADHPRVKVTRTSRGKPITSTAAGAFQFLERTWDYCQKALKLPDFSPKSQNLAATYLIQERGALDDVLAGRLFTAIRKCNKEWASLPGSPYGQPVMSLEKARDLYIKFGGALVEV